MLEFLLLGVILGGSCFRLYAQTPIPNPEVSSAPVLPSVTDTNAGSTPAGSEETMIMETKAPGVSASEIEQIYRGERDKFLTTLKKDIEPNLIKADIQKLNKNVMRLGSYRKDWVLSSEEFLTANAALAEPYLYRYAMLGNQRLNRAILRTLNHFQNLREPRAVLMFLHLFVDDTEQTVLAMDLLAKVVEQNPQLAVEAVSFLNGPISQKISLERRLQFGSRACSKVSSASLPAKEGLKAWQSKASSFWERVLADELDSCLKSV